MLMDLRFPHYLILAATLQWLARHGTAPHFLKRQDVVLGVQVDSNTPTTLAALHGRKDATWRHGRFDVNFLSLLASNVWKIEIILTLSMHGKFDRIEANGITVRLHMFDLS